MFDVFFEIDLIEGVFEFFDALLFCLQCFDKKLLEFIFLLLLLEEEIS